MSLQLQVTLLVLLAALLHAVWNALVKVHTDRMLTLGLVSLLGVVVALLLLPWVPRPPREVLIFLAGGVLCHLCFKLFLLQAYRVGDLGHVYPLARGSAPLLVALTSGDALSARQGWGVAAISLGVLSLAFDGGLPRRQHWAPIGFALLTGAFIAAYTVVDGLGARRMGNALGFTVWLFLCDGVLFAAIAFTLRRHHLRPHLGWPIVTPMLAGFISLAGYFIVIWAVSVGPMGPVAALRECGVVFAALIGSLFLKEPFGPRRIASAAVMTAGIVLMNLR